MEPLLGLGYLAAVAAETTPSSDDLGALRTPSVVLHSVLALLLLLVATVLAVYKPRGMTGYGVRKQQQRRARAACAARAERMPQRRPATQLARE